MKVSQQGRSDQIRPRVKRSVSSMTFHVIGEILITFSILIGLFVAWELWWTNVETSVKQDAAIEQFFEDPAKTMGPESTKEAAPAEDDSSSLANLNPGDTLGIMYIPRFGQNYARPIIEGTSAAELDTLGLGHYIDTAMPGEVGNFAVAGHRQTHGAVFDNIDTLVPGDRIYIQTKDSYFTYIFESSEIVLPKDVEVILPVPNHPKATPTERILTMTTCHPRYGSEQRFIAYSKLAEERSITDDPPTEIADQVKKASGRN